jgi:DNA-binding NtrC family response regulator
MSPRTGGDHCRNIVVADEDKAIAGLVIETLLSDGHLVISNTRVGGVDGLALIHELRERLPTLAIHYLANHGRSSIELEAQLPYNVPILREPFTADELRAAVRPLLAS